jgi:hypothetical protein
MPRVRSAEEKIVFELRKAAREAARAGEPNDFVTFDPPGAPGSVHMPAEAPLLAQLRKGDGNSLLFGADRLYLEDRGTFVRYEDITNLHWMKVDYDRTRLGEVLDLKRKFGDQIILEDRNGQYYELSRLGWGFQALWNFFSWLLRGKLPAGRDLPSPP